MKIIIVGSNGFIGSHCVRYFSQKGAEVWQAEITSKGKKNRFFLLEQKNTDFNKLFKEQKFDICINASGSASVGFSFDNPEIDYELNVYNLQKIALAIKTYNPNCKLINFSSAAVYGNPITLPIKENAEKSPLSPYGIHKLQSEELLRYYHIFFGIKTCSLRVFSAYGEGLKKQLFWDLYKKHIDPKTIKLYGTGNESRDFVYIEDLLQALDLILINTNFKGESINLSSGVETTIGYAVKCFYDCLDDQIEYTFNGEVRLGDPINWRADITTLADFGFKAKFNIKEGLKRYINWIKELK